MTYPVSIPNSFGAVTSGITSQLDANFNALRDALNGLGNGASVLTNPTITNLGNTVFTIANVTTLYGGNVVIAGGQATLANISFTALSNNSVVVGSGGALQGVQGTAAGQIITFNGLAWVALPSGAQSSALSSNVSLTNNAAYFDGPSIAAGNAGTFFVVGTVTCVDSTTGSTDYFVKLWDGTNTFGSGTGSQSVAGEIVSIAVNGVITNPAGNIKISVRERSANTGTIIAQDPSGNNRDSQITIVRIGT